ncbi:MAG: SGNH/GDSL hydrolase family protein [Spirochaetes bacterium]|jgi:lysophospholipase L1-like esterase|nr:SGNH/GDSL hydrolase family protein [Spirochaetota bacterium]
MKAVTTIRKLTEGSHAVIVALGDSLTQGWLVNKGYLVFLGEMLKEKYPKAQFDIINRGIPGDTAEGGLLRVREDVIEEDPDCVFIQFALNDAFIGYPVERFKHSLQSIIDRIRENTEAEIVLVTSVHLGDARDNAIAAPFYARIEDLASVNDLPVARVHEYWRKKISDGVEFRKLVQFDMVHPTVEGYRLMAEAIMEVFI